MNLKNRIFLSFLFISSQAIAQIDRNSQPIQQLQSSFCNCVEQLSKELRMDWASAVILCNYKKISINDSIFNLAEKFVQNRYKDSMMSDIDYMLQDTIILYAFNQCSYLRNVYIHNKKGLLKYLRDLRVVDSLVGNRPVDRAFDEGAHFALKIKQNDIESLSTHFILHKTFESYKVKLKELSSKIKDKNSTISMRQEEKEKLRVIIVTFIDPYAKALGQVRLYIGKDDPFAKIHRVDFIPKREIKYEPIEFPPRIGDE